jgi:hypothetical protein
MIDLQSESVVSLTAAAKSLPSRPHIATVYRWFQHGVRGIRLETVLLGGRRFTSHEALQRFTERLTAAAAGEPVPARTLKQREAAMQRAEAELAKAGI